MNEVFKKFAKEINYEIRDSLKNLCITKAELGKDNIFNIYFQNIEFIPIVDMIDFIDKMKNFKYKIRFEFEISTTVYNIETVKDYTLMICERIINKPSLSKSLPSLDCLITDSTFTIKTINEFSKNDFEKCSSLLQTWLRKFGFSDLDLVIDISKNKLDILEREKEELLKIAPMEFSNFTKPSFNSKKMNSYSYEAKPVEICELKESMLNNVLIEGEIFGIDQITTKNGLVIFSMSITCYHDAVYLKCFASNEKKMQEMKELKEGDYVQVRGQFASDAYTNQPTVTIRSINKHENKGDSRIDPSHEKRIEFSTRTRMSTMDGILTPKQLVDRAKQWGHEAIAILDENSVQSFPEFYFSSKSSNIKPIYGVSLTTLDKNSGAIFNPQDKFLANETYVVFDLETTGLSPIMNDIIEFGAVKVQNGQIVERKQFFVKPTHPIPEKITSFTNISNKDVEDSKPESEAIHDIHSYLSQGTMVAHNAKFDYNFINEKFEKYGLEKLNVACVDSLIVSRIVHPDKKRFRLESVANRYGVAYDVDVAHRADYDADVLAKVWLRMIDDLAKININTHLDLFEFKSNDLYSKAFNKEVSLIAKNQEGLKELFKYTSKALTDQLLSSPISFIEDFASRKNTLLGSGALKSRLVDLILTGSKEQIRDEISLYDYIEILPIDLFLHKFDDFDSDKIQEVIKFVISEAKRQNKIVIAIGDVRYNDLSEKIYHEVYIHSKGLGGKRHYLFKYGNSDSKYPDQVYLTTDEMKKKFAFLEDIDLINEIVIKNTKKLSSLIDKDIVVIKEKLYTPTFGDSDKDLENLVYKNARKIYGDNLPEIVEQRIKKEIEPIKKYGFSVIYWISHMLVAKSLNDGYLVGSRGSVGSSFVATMANITEVNPLEPHYICRNDQCKNSEWNINNELNSGYDLPDKDCTKCGTPYDKEGQKIPFETFLGFEANKVPDIDLNFSGEYQPIIHKEVRNIFGENHSFRAGTISTVAAKTAYGYVLAWSEETGREISKPFVEYLARGVEGTKRTTGQHPGGIIVIPKEYDVEDFSPINFPANDSNAQWKTTHFDFHAIHDNVLKLDLLGHDDPTAIRYLEKLTGVNAKNDIKFWDPKIIDLFSSTKSLGISPEEINGEKTGAMGIPEFGTKFVRGMLKKAKVKSFGDLISVSGLSHGTDVWTGNAEKVIAEHGKELNDVISCRDNIMTDLMSKGVESLTAFNIMEKVRKGKGITIDEEKLLKNHGVEDWYIDSLKKIKYMFPKAHATAYVMMAWRVAWFKLYYPVEYYATYFTTRADVSDIQTLVEGKEAVKIKLSHLNKNRNKRGSEALSAKEQNLIPIFEIALEAFARGVKIGNISIEKSHSTDWIIDNGIIIPPFTSIDGLGESVAKSIIEQRSIKKFTSIEDIQKRTSINKTNIEKLKELGVFRGLSQENQVSLFDLP